MSFMKKMSPPNKMAALYDFQGKPLPIEMYLISLDDMASEAAKDPRITDLFREGSQHKNISVIALNKKIVLQQKPDPQDKLPLSGAFQQPRGQAACDEINQTNVPD